MWRLKIIQVDDMVSIVWQVLWSSHYDNSNLELLTDASQSGSVNYSKQLVQFSNITSNYHFYNQVTVVTHKLH